MKLASPAKLNLFFRVLRKREDGFHEIASLYQAINLMDEIQIEPSTKDVFTCTDPTLDLGASNLVARALTIFRNRTQIHHPVAIHLRKEIPIEAGLAGGSGNAATTLWGLNELFNRPASIDDLKHWSAEMGSDISFFFSCGTAYCEGRGEKVTTVDSLPFSAWIAKPSFGLKTPTVYAHTNLGILKARDPRETMRKIFAQEGGYFNDLESAAFHLEPRLKKLKHQLEEIGFDKVVMTGSGTAFFCLGNCKPSPLYGVDFYFVQNAQRKSNAWYSYHKNEVCHEAEKDF